MFCFIILNGMTAIQDKSEEFSRKYGYSGGFYKLEEFKNLFIFFSC